MLRMIPVAGIVLLAAGTCGEPPEKKAPASASQTAGEDGPQTGEFGELQNVNEHLGELKTDVQKQADDRARTIDDKIERGNQ